MPEQQSRIKSCISDQPLENNNGDTLKNNQYAKGLVKFIKVADAPITIGIQGGWGSGKTSLINMLQRELESTGECICINVNAWQQSLFTSGASGQIAISLLESVHSEMLDKIKSNDSIDPELKKKILNEDSHLQKAGKIIGGIAIQAAKIAVRSYAGVEGGDAQQNQQQAPYKPSQTLKKLRENLCEATKEVIDRTNIQRFVIFVDDLDRIQPHTAVEILDVLKNIFDTPGLISVLAVDYEVIIKGLREKFGEKSEENGREFRQYFDKIIQIPFSMPTGAYKDNMLPLLKNFFETLNFQLNSSDQEFLADIAYKATDGVPRSIKRIVNTMSLHSIINAERDSGNRAEKNKTAQPEIDQEKNKDDLKIRFIAICLQINIPEIYRAIAQDLEFWKWNSSTAATRWNIHTEPTIETLNRYGDSFNAEWKRALFSLISASAHLLPKAHDILEILDELKNLASKEGGLRLLRKAITSANITNTDHENNQPDTNLIDNKLITENCKEILTAIIEQLNKIETLNFGTIDNRRKAKESSSSIFRTLSHPIDDNPVCSQIDITWNEETNLYEADFNITPRRGAVTIFRNSLLSKLPEEFYPCDTDWYSFSIENLEKNGKIQPDINNLKHKKIPILESFIEAAISLRQNIR